MPVHSCATRLLVSGLYTAMKFARILEVLFFVLTLIPPAFGETKASSTGRSTTGFGLDRTAEALARHKYNRERAGLAATASMNRLANDQDNVSVIDDDGTLLIPENLFDLSNRSLTFVPQGAVYTVQSGAGAFVASSGGAVVEPLGDDDSIPIALPFAFSFYGVPYTNLFLNTDGNLTFTASDAYSGPRDLRHVLTGIPRIAPLFDDFLPSTTGVITVEQRADRVLISWNRIAEYGLFARSTFQVILQSDGVITFNYQAVNVSSAIIALSPGNAPSVNLIDFSMQTVPAPASGMIA